MDASKMLFPHASIPFETAPTMPIDLARWLASRGLQLSFAWRPIASFPEGDLFARLVKDFDPYSNTSIEIKIPQALQDADIIQLLHRKRIPADVSIPPTYSNCSSSGDLIATFHLVA